MTGHLRFLAVIGVALAVSAPAPAVAQQRSVTDVLSFLLTNRSIATDDAAQDEAAAAATRDTISRFLLVELATLPTLSSTSGFIYRMDRDLGGTVVRTSDSFGPAFVDRSLTVGALRFAFGTAFQEASFNTIDDRSLIKIDFYVPERFAANMVVGGRLTASPIARPEEVFDGTVSAVDNRVDDNSRTLLVQAEIPNDRDTLRAGMSFRISVEFPGDTYP